MPELFYQWQLADELLTETERLIAEASRRVHDKEGPGPTNLQLEVAGNLRQTVRECLRKAGGSIVDAPNALAENNEGTFAPQSKKVLIVEDEEILAENLQAHFHRSGWDARIANTGEAAVIAAGEFRPGMILLDYHLPDMNGFEALAAIRAVHCCSCALMTGHPADTVLAEAQRHGIERILAKPFSLAGLEGQLWATAAEFCSKCFENGRRPSREDCGGFAPAQQAHPQDAVAPLFVATGLAYVGIAQKAAPFLLDAAGDWRRRR